MWLLGTELDPLEEQLVPSTIEHLSSPILPETLLNHDRVSIIPLALTPCIPVPLLYPVAPFLLALPSTLAAESLMPPVSSPPRESILSSAKFILLEYILQLYDSF